MPKENLSPFANFKFDAPASLVVVLVALPLCLGIALASGAPLFSGVIAGIVGGIVVGALSKSPLSISGPAAGLTTIVLSAIHDLPSLPAFFLAVCLAGVIQIFLGLVKAGVIGDFIPSTVIKGMLAAIGIILILKQLPHAIGYDVNHQGDYAFREASGENTFSSLWVMLQQNLHFGAIIISALSLAFLFWWDKKQPYVKSFFRYVPGPLVVVLFGVLANEVFKLYMPDFTILPEHLVAVPIAGNVNEFLGQFSFPDFAYIGDAKVWIAAATLAIVASIETLLSIEAIDKLDPYKRVTPTNRELFAQGVGNIVSGALGGLPVTSVIVRSSANVTAGGKTKASAILHGLLLLLFVVAIPSLLNYIPLAALAAILIAVGYKLTKPAIFYKKYKHGIAYFVPFVVTIAAILLTDLLIGIAIGVGVGMAFVVWENYNSAILLVPDQNNVLVRFKKDLFFIHKYELKKVLDKINPGSQVLIDFTRVGYIDHDNIEIINDFIMGAKYKDIHITLKLNTDSKSTSLIVEPENAAI